MEEKFDFLEEKAMDEKISEKFIKSVNENKNRRNRV